MVSALSEYCTDSVILEGKDRAKKIVGKLAAQYYPGTVVYQSAAGPVWTATTGTQSFNNVRRSYGIVEFPKRTSSTFGEVDIDTYITDGTKRNCEIIVGPLDGTVKVAVLCKATNASGYYGMPMIPSSGGKAFSVGSAWAAKVSYNNVIGFLSEDGFAGTDTVARIYLSR